MTQELVNNFLCRYECFGWSGGEFVSRLIPELTPSPNTLDEVPLPIRMNTLVLLLHTSNKAKLLNEIVPSIPNLITMLKERSDVRDSAALVLTEYIALQSLPPIPNQSSFKINDPSFDGGIKMSLVQDYGGNYHHLTSSIIRVFLGMHYLCCSNPI